MGGRWVGSGLFSSSSVCTVGTSAGGRELGRLGALLLFLGVHCGNLRRGGHARDVINVTPRQTDDGMQTRTERESARCGSL